MPMAPEFRLNVEIARFLIIFCEKLNPAAIALAH